MHKYAYQLLYINVIFLESVRLTMLTHTELSELINVGVPRGKQKIQLSRLHRCLINGVNDENSILSSLRGAPHVVFCILYLVDDYTTTLRNINYVKLCPQQRLLKEYSKAIECASGRTRSALQEWRNFLNLNNDILKDFPSSYHSLAMNQLSSSAVYLDTLDWKGKSLQDNSMYWLNRPSNSKNSVLMRYDCSGQAIYCVGTSVEGNLVAICMADEVLVHEMDSGILLCQLPHRCTFDPCIIFGIDETEIYFADESLHKIHVYDARTGVLKWTYDINMQVIYHGETLNDWVVWMYCVDDSIVCGTYGGRVIFIHTSTHAALATWTVCDEYWNQHALAYCYHPKKRWIISAHNFKELRFWSHTGGLQRTLHLEGKVDDIALHPKKDIIACAMRSGRDPIGREKDVKYIQISLDTGAVLSTVDRTNTAYIDSRHYISYMVYKEQVTLICVDEDQWIMSCDEDGKVLNTAGRMDESINKISVIPSTNRVLSAGYGGCILYSMDNLDDERSESIIYSCVFLHDGDFITHRGSGEVEKWSSRTFESSVIANDTSYGLMRIHPQKDIIFVLSKDKILILETVSVQLVSTFTHESIGDRVGDIIISQDGEKLVLVWENGTGVYDIRDLNKIQLLGTYTMKIVESSDIHKDGNQIITAGSEGLKLWHVSKPPGDSGVCLMDVRGVFTHQCRVAKFVYNPDRILYVNDFNLIMLDYQGAVIYSTEIGNVWTDVVVKDTYFITAADFNIKSHDLRNGKLSSIFYHHSSKEFTSLAVNEEGTMVIAGNDDGELYALNLAITI